MTKKSKRKRFTNQLSNGIEIRNNNNNNGSETYRKNYVTTIYVPSSKRNNNNLQQNESNENYQRSSSSNEETENAKDLCKLIKECCFKRNEDNLDNYNTPYIILPSWFQNVVQILCNDLRIV